LVTLSKLLAPSIPFLAEELYQNLVRCVDDAAPESVHLADWPLVNRAKIDEKLNRDMRLVMNLASLGHAARNQAGIKVRQPLAEVAFSISNKEEKGALQRYAGLLADELNVKQVRVLGSAGESVSYSLKPLPRQLGQKYQAKFPKISEAILELDLEGAARALLDGHSLLVSVEGQAYKILPEEVEVRTEAKSGFTVASEGAYLAALKTDLTPELVSEGLAREFVRHVQDLRKQIGLDIADRITLYVEATSRLAEAIQSHQEYIIEETLAVNIISGKPEANPKELAFDGEQVTIGITKS
jgi:isoleucyl-tRNA synthetase